MRAIALDDRAHRRQLIGQTTMVDDEQPFFWGVSNYWGDIVKFVTVIIDWFTYPDFVVARDDKRRRWRQLNLVNCTEPENTVKR